MKWHWVNALFYLFLFRHKHTHTHTHTRETRLQTIHWTAQSNAVCSFTFVIWNMFVSIKPLPINRLPCIKCGMEHVPVWSSASDTHCIPYNTEWSMSRCGLQLLTYTVSHTIPDEACPGVVFNFWHSLHPIQYGMKHVPVWSSTSDIHCISYNTGWSMSRCGLQLLTHTVSHTIRNEACPGVVFYFWHSLYPIQYGMKHVPVWFSTSDIHCIPYNTEWSMSRCGFLLLTYTVSHTIRNEACPDVVFYFWHTLYPTQYGMKHVLVWSSTSDIHCIPYNTEWSMSRCGLVLLTYTVCHTIRNEACPGVVFYFWHTLYPIQYGLKHIPVWSTSDIHCIPYNTEWSMSRCGLLLLTYTVSHAIRNEACPGVVFFSDIHCIPYNEACPGVVYFWYTLYPIQCGMKHVQVWSTSDIQCIPYNTEWSISRFGLLLTYTVSHTIRNEACPGVVFYFWHTLYLIQYGPLPLVVCLYCFERMYVICI